MAICRLAIQAYRDNEWPADGTSEYDLREMIEACDEWQGEGLSYFPHDSDVNLELFAEWAVGILENDRGATTQRPPDTQPPPG